MEDIIRAAKIVNAHDFIMRLEKGYDTQVGERGSRLSTGQKQLISFARAILSDPGMFVLDEATSSVDTETEHLIQDALNKALEGRTSFIIAHRLPPFGRQTGFWSSTREGLSKKEPTRSCLRKKVTITGSIPTSSWKSTGRRRLKRRVRDKTKRIKARCALNKRAAEKSATRFFQPVRAYFAPPLSWRQDSLRLPRRPVQNPNLCPPAHPPIRARPYRAYPGCCSIVPAF